MMIRQRGLKDVTDPTSRRMELSLTDMGFVERNLVGFGDNDKY